MSKLVKNIDELTFKVTNKEIDDKKQNNARNKSKSTKPKKNRDYIKEHKKKQIIGDIGENIILKNEIDSLKNSGEAELIKRADAVEWSSKVIGDGLGYDIKSFDIKDRKIIYKYIEVKTAIGHDCGFEITASEVEKSQELNKKGMYIIARIYNLNIKNKTANLYYKEGYLEKNYDLKPSVYIANKK